MLAALVNIAEAIARSVILFFLSPFIYVANAVLTLLTRRSKTASNVIVKAQLIRDVILQSPPPSYQSATKSDQAVIRLRGLETSLQKRESELSVRSSVLEKRQQQLETERGVLDKREAKIKEKEKSLEGRYKIHYTVETEFTARREKLEEDLDALRQEQAEVRQLREIVKKERQDVSKQRSDNTVAVQQSQDERKKHEEYVVVSQKRLDDRQTEINSLHDRFLRSQLESMEHHRSEHNALIDSLKSRLAESQRILETELQRSQSQQRKYDETQSELEQRCAFLTHELADRTEREFNLGSELGELRQKLSEERGLFNREFGELSKALTELKSRCSQYENEISGREQLLQTRSQNLEESEEAMKRRLLELAGKEEDLEKQKASLDDRVNDLRNLQSAVEERSKQVTEAENDLVIRMKGYEDAVKHIRMHDEPSNEPSDISEIPDTTSPESLHASSVGPYSLSGSRPTIRERVSRRTSEFVERVNSAAHRRSTSYSSHRNSHDDPPRMTKSRDGLKSEAK